MVGSDEDESIKEYPRRCSNLVRLIGKTFMFLSGWKVEGNIPARNKVIIIAAPHTTNWDFVYLLGAAYQLGLNIRWLGKQSLFRFPFGGIMRALGGIAVHRSKANGMVQAKWEGVSINSYQSDTVTLQGPGAESKAALFEELFAK